MSYFDSAVWSAQRKMTTDKALSCLWPLQFDAIAFRGVSGAVLAPILAFLLDKELLPVRKPDESAHSSSLVESSSAGIRSYIIVDDFISTGATVKAILAAVKSWLPDAEFVGVYEYQRIPHGEASNICETEGWPHLNGAS